ncbi:MAG: hypothetical protein ABSB82_15780 [Terriglobia bacterium]|jgi:hypothetical protein
MDTYLSEIYESFSKVQGWLLAVLGIVISIVAFVFVPSTAVTLKVIVPIGAVILIVIAILIDLSIRLYRRAKKPLPRVRFGLAPPSSYPESVAILLLDSSDLFGQDSIVSIYRLEEQFERFAGLGFVSTIQENGLVQVIVTEAYATDDEDFWKGVRGNNGTMLSTLSVKPFITRTMMARGDQNG